MQLNTLTAKHVNSTTSDVTFDFEVSARIDAAEETRVPWSLWISCVAFGTRPVRLPNGTYIPTPTGNGFTDVVGEPQTAGGGQGEIWTTTYRHTMQKNQVLVPDNDQYLFQGKLIPTVDLHESGIVQDLLVKDID